MAKEGLSFPGIEALGTSRHEGELENGSKLVVFERPGMPVYMRASLFAGSRFDPLDKGGLSHFSEHMVAAGTRRFPTKDKLAAHIEQYGGSIGATIGLEILSVNTEVGDPKDLRVGMKVMHEMLLEPLFRKRTIESERSSIQRELGVKKSNPSEMAWDVYKRLFYQGTPVGRSGLGSEESINRISKPDLDEFYANNFRSGNTTFVVSGGVKFDEVMKMGQDYLNLPRSKRFTLPTSLPIIRDKAVDIEPYVGKDQVHLVLGFRTTPRFHPDNPALDVITEIIGGGRASSLIRLLRYGRGLVYGVWGYQLSLSDSGAWVIKTSTAKDKLNEVLSIISGEIKRIQNHGLTQKEVCFAQNKIVKSARMDLQTSSDWVDWHSEYELTGNNPSELKDQMDGILKVTPESTRIVAQNYFAPGKWYLGICGDVKNDDSVVINL